MKHISKESEPTGFENWKIQEKDTIERLLTLNKPGDAIWKHLPSNLPNHPEDDVFYYSN